MGRVDKRSLLDCFLFDGSFPPTLYCPSYTDAAFWKTMASFLNDDIPTKALSRLGESMPWCEPYTSTHGDLGLRNIIVNNGNIISIINWEWAGFFPVWWEYTRLYISPTIDEEWKELLMSRIKQYLKAKIFLEKHHFLLPTKLCTYSSHRPTVTSPSKNI